MFFVSKVCHPRGGISVTEGKHCCTCDCSQPAVWNARRQDMMQMNPDCCCRTPCPYGGLCRRDSHHRSGVHVYATRAVGSTPNVWVFGVDLRNGENTKMYPTKLQDETIALPLLLILPLPYLSSRHNGGSSREKPTTE